MTDKPCLIHTEQGVSVSYNGHLLYSKYNPAKNIVKKIAETDFLPGSVILCLSPVLPHGLRELMEKLPENCMAILCEKNQELFDFSASFFGADSLCKKKAASNRIFRPAPSELDALPQWIYGQNKSGQYRRVIAIDFSAGTQLNQQYYKLLGEACTDAMMTYWKNRVTLTKFGRKYSRNFFANLKAMPRTTPIENFLGKITRPILCFGAGESTDYFFDNIAIEKLHRQDFFILCADTALAALQARGIVPDGVFIEEAQSVILGSFIGSAGKTDVHIFAGLSSVPQLRRCFRENQVSYFFTEFTQADFIDRAKEKGFLPHANPAFGSVGLTMVHYALLFRASDELPVYVCGLDFSYSVGRTHARGTPAHKNKLISQTRLSSIYDFKAAYNQNALPFTEKSGRTFITTKILMSYSQIFRQIFAGTKNLFDSGKTGISLAIPAKNAMENRASKISGKNPRENFFDAAESAEKITEFLAEEKNALLNLRALLTENQGISEAERREKITALAACREYLFLHYPDGMAFRYEQSFLNRIRTEIDFFLRLF